MDNPDNNGGREESPEWVKFTTQLSSQAVKRKFKAICASEGRDMREVVNALIQQWLDER